MFRSVICLTLLFLLPAFAAAAAPTDRAMVDRIATFARSARSQQEWTQLYWEYRRLDDNARYGDLDALQAALREPSNNQPGMSGLEYFYESLMRRTRGTTLPQLIERRKKWLEACPNSVAARVLLGNAYAEWGEEARGSDWADSVTQEGWRLLAERMAVAASYFKDAAALPGADAEVFASSLIVANHANWSRKQTETAFARATALDKRYAPAWRGMMFYLLPRWHGQPGDLADLIRRSAQIRGDHVGCADLAAMMYRLEKQALFTVDAVPWPLVKTGFEEKLKLYPDGPGHLETLNYFAALACLAGDRGAARAAFTSLGNNVDPRYFPRDRTLDEWRAWASK